jgi:hypothetical protein
LDITSLLIQLVSGAVGGNIGAALLSQLGMGGGGALASVGSGGVGGIVLMLVVGFIKKAMAK